MIFYFKVSGDCLELIEVKDRAYSGNVNSYICRFELDGKWQGLDCFATFGTGDKFYTVVVTSSGEAVIPEEALLAGETLVVGLFGTNAGGENYVRLSTGFAEIQVGQGAYIPDATAPALPAPDVWEELICRNIPKIGENGNWYIWDIPSGEYRDSGVSASGEDNHDAILLAMYNEVIEPSPEDWFIVDENDPSSIVGFNLDGYGDTLWEEDAIIFPYEINGVGIRKIHFSYFDYQLSANTIRFPNCITEICMEGTAIGVIAYHVESINIPTSCAYLSGMCFSNMAALKEVISPIKPNWELVMGSGCFSDCYSLNNIDTIIDGIKEIPDAAFYHCGGVKNVVIPESVEKIGGEALAFVNDGSFNCITILNADCDLSYEGFIFSNEEYYPKVIKGYTGSTAEELARKIGVKFVSLDMISGDWNQNDETATDYINNRTHYDATYYIGGVEVQNLADDEPEVTFEYPLETGKEYRYLFDFTYVDKENEDDPYYHEKEEGTFVITELPEEGQTLELTIGGRKGQLEYDGVYYSWKMDIDSWPAYSGILSFYGGELKKLDEKYIPDTVARKAEFDSIDEALDRIIAIQESLIGGESV